MRGSRARHLVEQLAGAVGRVVVDEQDVGVAERGEQPAGDVLDVLALVVRRHDDQRLGHRRDDSDPTLARCAMLARLVRSRRAWIYVLSVLALLVPAAGIAYLGAVSYRDERGAVAAQTRAPAPGRARDRGADRPRDRARRSMRVDRTRSTAAGTQRSTRRSRSYWFWIDADGQLRVPRASPPAIELGGRRSSAARRARARSRTACAS